MLELNTEKTIKRPTNNRNIKTSSLARLIHEFAKNFHNFIFYNQLCNLCQKSLFRWNNWQVQYLRQVLRFYEFFGLGTIVYNPQNLFAMDREILPCVRNLYINSKKSYPHPAVEAVQ